MPYYPTQADINLLLQSSKHIYCRVELLNKNLMVIESLEGNLTSDSYNNDSTSNIRRTYDCTLEVTDSTFNLGKNKKIWFDKYIRPYVGIYSLREKQVIWYLKGTFSTATATYKYDSHSNTLSLQCSDLMCMLTGDIDGKQTGLGFKIDIGEDIRTSIIGILSQFKFYKYQIPDLKRTIPSGIDFSAGATAFEIITELMQFCPNYEFFFDLDGTFIIQRIPCYTNDTDILDASLFEKLLISEDNYTLNFTAKNCIELWGKTYSESSVDRYTSNCTYSGNIYTALFDNFTVLKDSMIIQIKIPATNQAGFKIKLNNLGTLTVFDDYERNIKEGVLEPATDYTFMYRQSKLYLLGQTNIHAICKNESPDSPFSIENVGKELWDVLSGNEYENTMSETLAKERAMYECYYKSNLNESLSLTLVDIPWLDVNQKITYLLKSTNQSYRWMINSISGETLSGQCSVSFSRFYPDWSEIFRQEFV